MSRREAVKHYDCIIVGAGQAGVPLAKEFAAAGKQTALIERVHIGGTCVNEGCTPTKTMIASGEVAYLSKRAGNFGVTSGYAGVDMEKVRQRKRDMVQSFMSSSLDSLKSTANLDLVFGHAHFTAPKEIGVLMPDGTSLPMTAETIVLDVGCRPQMPSIEGLDKVPALDSTSIMELYTVPEHLIILGGGYIGCEFGQLFNRFGSHVTIVQRSPQMLDREDKDISKAMADLFREEGMRVLLASEAILVEKGAEKLRVTINSHGVELPIEGSHILVSLGRVPNTEGLDLQLAGVKCNEHGYIEVNDCLETNVAGVYATGDVNGGPQFTHISYDDHRILRNNLLQSGSSSTSGRLVPYTVFTDPQLGRIGIGEDEAKRQGLKVKVARLEMSSVARAIETDRAKGFMKAVVDADTEQILGFSCLGFNGGEIMSMVEIAMMGKLPYTALREGIFSHPTLAECFNNLFESFE